MKPETMRVPGTEKGEGIVGFDTFPFVYWRVLLPTGIGVSCLFKPIIGSF
jgi:hypothetical protein